MGQLKLQRTVCNSSNVCISTQLVTEPTAAQLLWLPDTKGDANTIGLGRLETLVGFPENLADDWDHVATADGCVLSTLGKIKATLKAGQSSHSVCWRILVTTSAVIAGIGLVTWHG